MRFDLSDREWSIIEPQLPPTRQGGERADDRRVLDGIFYVLRSGIPWSDLPSRYGPPTTVYNRFRRWAKQGIWERIFQALEQQYPSSVEMIDTTVIPAHRAAAGAEKLAAPRCRPVSALRLSRRLQPYRLYGIPVVNKSCTGGLRTYRRLGTAHRIAFDLTVVTVDFEKAGGRCAVCPAHMRPS